MTKLQNFGESDWKDGSVVKSAIDVVAEDQVQFQVPTLDQS